MYSPLRLLAASLLAAASLWPITTSAQTDDSSAMVERVRSAYNLAGYQVDAPLTWNWTRPPVSTFRVHDAAHDRVLLVLVYPSQSAAIAGRLQGEAHDEALTGGRALLDSGYGPHLVLGFGPSTWRGDVALVQASESVLANAYTAQAGGMGLDGLTLGQNNAAVDPDFLQALDNGVANL